MPLRHPGRRGEADASPTPLSDQHQLGQFNCGDESLDVWLKRRARPNQISDASRTYVVCESTKVVAYYALASGSIANREAAGKFSRNMPDPIPVAVLGRLAVDRSWQGQRLGRALFVDAARRVLSASEAVGLRGLLVHALSLEAKVFYERLGLRPS